MVQATQPDTPRPLPFEWIPDRTAATLCCLVIMALFLFGGTSMGVCAAYMTGILLLPTLRRVGFTLVQDWANHLGDYVKAERTFLDEWTSGQMGDFYLSKPTALSGLAVVTCSLVMHWVSGAFDDLGIRLVLVLLCVVAAAFLTGVALYDVFLMNRLVWRSGQFALKTYFSPSMVYQTGNLLSRVHLLAGVGWASVTWAALFDSRLQVVVEFIAAPVAFAICASFLLIQIPFHRQLVLHKREAQRRIDDAITAILDLGLSTVSEQREQIEFLTQQGHRVQSLPDWPFRWSNLLGVAASVVSATIPPVLALALDPEKRGEAIRLARAIVGGAI